ncbi:MAG: hypothetical protein ACXWZ5_19830 [Mycobacterium sp.]
MSGQLDNKVVIVAGLGGIGNGLARRYADEGARLVVGDLDPQTVSRVVAEVDPSGQRDSGWHSTAPRRSRSSRSSSSRWTHSAGSTACT